MTITFGWKIRDDRFSDICSLTAKVTGIILAHNMLDDDYKTTEEWFAAREKKGEEMWLGLTDAERDGYVQAVKAMLGATLTQAEEESIPEASSSMEADDFFEWVRREARKSYPALYAALVLAEQRKKVDGAVQDLLMEWAQL